MSIWIGLHKPSLTVLGLDCVFVIGVLACQLSLHGETVVHFQSTRSAITPYGITN